MESALHIESVWTFLACALAVEGLRRALFASIPAREVEFWIQSRLRPSHERIKRLVWELNNGVSGDDRDHKLTAEEAADRSAELRRIARGTRWLRFAQYGMGCAECQSAWTALLLFAVTGWPGIVPAAVTAFAYSVLGSVLRATCKSCGGNKK